MASGYGGVNGFEDAAGTEFLSPSILLVENVPVNALAARQALTSHGFDVTLATDGADALALASRQAFDLVLLQLALPTLSGFEVCRRLRESGDVRILIFSETDTESDRVLSLDLGADGFLSKPFSSTELVARVRAVLRRRDLDESGAALRRIGALTIDLGRHEVVVEDQRVTLTPSEFKILELLSRDAGRVFSRTEIVQEVWRSDYVGDRRSCDIHVTNLRRKIELGSETLPRIVTIRGIGYKLDVDGTAGSSL